MITNMFKKNKYYIFNNHKTIFLNNSKHLIGMNNSVYDICFYNNVLLILDYRNNKLVFYDIKNQLIKNQLSIESPHGAHRRNNLLYISNYKNKEVIIIENFKIIKKYKFKKYFPLNIIHFHKKILLINWNNNLYKNLILLNDKFEFIKKFDTHNHHDKPHAGFFFMNKIYVASHSKNDPKIIVYSPAGKIVDIIKNKYIKDPLSIKIFKKNIFIADYSINSIAVFDLKFDFKYFIKNKFYYPMNIAFNKKNLYLCEEKSNRILSYEINYD